MKSYSSIFGDELGVTLNVRSEDVAMVWGHMHFDLRRFQGGGLTSNEVYQCFVKHLNEANEALNLTLSSLKKRHISLSDPNTWGDYSNYINYIFEIAHDIGMFYEESMNESVSQRKYPYVYYAMYNF
jgi:hypothetical protein